jgi:hypothetical protein
MKHYHHENRSILLLYNSTAYHVNGKVSAIGRVSKDFTYLVTGFAPIVTYISWPGFNIIKLKGHCLILSLKALHLSMTPSLLTR